MKNILCFGDSNTYGFVPGSFDFSNFYFERYAYDKRWTGILAKALGHDYAIIEEGLNGRNTCIDDPLAPPGVELNACKMLPGTLMSHNPLNLVIFMLGTNDTKNYFGLNANMIGNGMRKLIMTTKGFCAGYQTKILILAPPVQVSGVEVFGGSFDDEAREKSQQLAAVYEEICQFEGCAFLDAGQVANFSTKDGLHLDEVGHQGLAQALYDKVKQLIG